MIDWTRNRFTGPLKPQREGFWTALLVQGYTEHGAKQQLHAMAHLSRWLEGRHRGVEELCASDLKAFIVERRRAGYTHCFSERGLAPLTRYLQARGILAPDKTRSPETPLDGLLRDYTRYLDEQRALVPDTVLRYLDVARRFLTGLDVGHLTAADVGAFVLQQARDYAIGTAKYAVTALRSLLRYLQIRGLCGDLAGAVPSVAGWRLSGLPRASSPDEVRQLLRECDRRSDVGRRNFAVLLLLVRLGLRRGEVAALELDDISWKQGELIVRGKGRRQDRLPLPADVGRALAAYLRRSRPRVAHRALFVQAHAPYQRLGTSGISTLVERAFQRAGLAVAGPHTLRHTAATLMLARGASLSEIGHVLRHRSIETTSLYTKVDRVALRSLAQPWPGGEA